MTFTTIGLSGPAGSGKDLVADWFGKQGFVKVGFADPIKRFVMNCFGIEEDVLWGSSEKRNQEFEVTEDWWFSAFGRFGVSCGEILNKVMDPSTRTTGFIALHDWLTDLRRAYRNKISTRVILQTLGTDWGRSVDESMWLKYCHWVSTEIRLGRPYSQKDGLADRWNDKAAPGVIIPDHRFHNEVKHTQEHGGFVFRLKRLSMENTTTTVGVEGHKSETEQKSLPDSAFDHVLEFGEGVDKVHKVLEEAYEMKSWMRGNKNRL